MWGLVRGKRKENKEALFQMWQSRQRGEVVDLRCEGLEEAHFGQRKQPRVRRSRGGRYLLPEPVESLNDTRALALECSIIRQVSESFSSDKRGQRGKWGPHPCFLYTGPLSPTPARPRSRTGGEKADGAKQEGSFSAVPPLTPGCSAFHPGRARPLVSPHLCPCQLPAPTLHWEALPLQTVTSC